MKKFNTNSNAYIIVYSTVMVVAVAMVVAVVVVVGVCFQELSAVC